MGVKTLHLFSNNKYNMINKFFNDATVFFNCYWDAPEPPMGHYRGDSLTHPILSTVLFIFDPKVT